MANLYEDIQCASFDTHPPMLDRTDFESWQQQEKERFKADICATNILLQGLPKDIYTIINHYTDAKDIWDNVKMLLKGFELIKMNVNHNCTMNLNTSIRTKEKPFTNAILGHIARQCSHLKRPWNSEYFKEKMMLMHAQENGVVLDEEQLLFIASGQANTFDDDADQAPTMFMTSLSSANPIYDEAGPSYDSDILSEVQDHDNYIDSVGEYHEVHKMQNDVQLNEVVDSDAEYMSDISIIPYEHYAKDNAVQVIQSNVSNVTNDALMMIINDMHEQYAQCVYENKLNKVVNESLTAKLARYKEQVELYEKMARFELTEREQKINEHMRIIIQDSNVQEELL
nr:hypothetical protein [Tanacetum cinerariifolium]